MTGPRWALVPTALLGLFVLTAHPRAAVAGTEEFSTFSAEAQEEDDESLLDHLLTRTPRAWRDEWERAPQAIRTAQGCLTSGQWFLDTDLKLRAPMGDRARFGLALRQSESDVASYDYLDFSFAFPTRWGTPGAMFRPLHDKSRQDFAFTWEAGNDTAGTSVLAVFTLEDVFNNLWAFRQDRVGNGSEPYLRRPYEPAFRVVHRADHWRAEISGKYLTPSVKSVLPWTPEAAPREASLWGTHGHASLEASALGLEWEVSGTEPPGEEHRPAARRSGRRCARVPAELVGGDGAPPRRSPARDARGARSLPGSRARLPPAARRRLVRRDRPPRGSRGERRDRARAARARRRALRPHHGRQGGTNALRRATARAPNLAPTSAWWPASGG